MVKDARWRADDGTLEEKHLDLFRDNKEFILSQNYVNDAKYCFERLRVPLEPWLYIQDFQPPRLVETENTASLQNQDDQRFVPGCLNDEQVRQNRSRLRLVYHDLKS